VGPEALGTLMAPGFLGATAAIGFIAFAYFMLTLDRGRANSPSKDDTQAGIKLVLWALIIAGVATVSGGVVELLGYMLSGFKGGSVPVKHSLPTILVGALVIVVAAKAFMPRTNNSTHHQVERYALGMLGLGYGLMALFALNMLLEGLFNDAPWGANASSIASLLVALAVAGFSIPRFGGMSGWTAPVAPPPMAPPQYPPQGGGYPPQGGGYPPQGGGYPPQGGGYPPQGGGYPPQGGGYPPQGGGYGR
jgi:hypothetical protein